MKKLTNVNEIIVYQADGLMLKRVTTSTGRLLHYAIEHDEIVEQGVVCKRVDYFKPIGADCSNEEEEGANDKD